MAKDWEKLAGDRGRRVETGRIGRALKLGKLAGKVAGSTVKAGIARAAGSTADPIAAAAMRNARHIVDVMGEMKGAAMKVGQLLSADPDLVAPEFADKLAALQQSAPPMTFNTVSKVIEDALDQQIPALFSFFDPEPLGSASIGQVHRATLRDGRPVAVKVQYPGIKASLDSDLRNLGTLLRSARVFLSRERADEFVAEARVTILAEADYAAEGRNLERFKGLLGGLEGVIVPAPVLEHTAETVLVMEYVEGRKLDEALAEISDKAERSRICDRFVESFVVMFHDLQVIHGDPHPGNFMLSSTGEVVLLDFGCVRDFPVETTDGILRLLLAFWDDDMGKVSRLLQEQGFGRDGGRMPSHEVLRTYLHLILAPLVERAPFNYSRWSVHGRARAYVLKNPDMLRLVPPAELLLYFRVLAGMKGLMTRVDAEVDLRRMAEDACRRRGLL